MSKTEHTDQLNILGDHFLVERLKGVPADILEGLWVRLLDGDEGRLATGSAVKTMFDAAIKSGLFTEGALQVFVAELQHYGGNAAANMLRGAGVSYVEILNDTLDYLKFVGTRDQQLELLEETVVSHQVHMLWDLGGADVQSRIAKSVGSEASWKAVSAALEQPESLLAAASFLCDDDYATDLLHANAGLPENDAAASGGLFGGVFGAIAGKGIAKAVNELTPKTLMGKVASVVSSHRVTLPCVNQLIRIRLMRELRAEFSTPHQPREHESVASNVVHLPEREQVVVRDEAGNEALSMMDLAISALPVEANRLDLGKTGISRLSSLFQAAPTAMVANEASDERFMKVVVAGPLALAKDGNGFRGFVKGADGKITEHVRLFEGELSQVVNAAALFNVASMALAQKHLADISARLDEIQQGVDRISTFQKRQREAEIAGAIQYLRQIAGPIMAGEMRDAFEKQLEDAESRLLIVQNHLKSDIEGFANEVLGAKDEGKFGMTVFRNKLTGLQVDFNETVHQWKLCLAARMMASRLLCNFPGARHSVEAREKSIRDDMNWLTGPGGAIERMEANVEGRMSDFSAWGDSRIELQASRETVRITQQATLPALKSDAQLLSTQFHRLMRDTRMPVELMLAVRNGQVAELATL